VLREPLQCNGSLFMHRALFCGLLSSLAATQSAFYNVKENVLTHNVHI